MTTEDREPAGWMMDCCFCGKHNINPHFHYMHCSTSHIPNEETVKKYSAAYRKRKGLTLPTE